MANERQDDALFLRQLRKNNLVKEYSSLKNKLPIKPKLEAGSSVKLPKSVLTRASIRDCAVGKRLLRIVYKKTSSNETKQYLVEPYSFRYVKQNGGFKKALYAWDIHENKIKYFVVKAIIKSEGTDKHFASRFPIEIAKGVKDLLYSPRKQDQ